MARNCLERDRSMSFQLFLSRSIDPLNLAKQESSAWVQQLPGLVLADKDSFACGDELPFRRHGTRTEPELKGTSIARTCRKR